MFFRRCLSAGTPQQIHDRAKSPDHVVGNMSTDLVGSERVRRHPHHRA
jgi:hypothetical protein